MPRPGFGMTASSTRARAATYWRCRFRPPSTPRSTKPASACSECEEERMKRDVINAKNAPQPRGGYTQAIKLENFEKLLFVSGQIPTSSDDALPEGFTAQARQVWLNV